MRTIKFITVSVVAVLISLCVILFVFWQYINFSETVVKQIKIKNGGYIEITRTLDGGMTGPGYFYSVYFRLRDKEKFRLLTGWKGPETMGFDDLKIFDNNNLIVIYRSGGNRLYSLNKNIKVGNNQWRPISLNFPYSKSYSYLTFYSGMTTLDEETLMLIMDSREALKTNFNSASIVRFDIETKKLVVSYPYTLKREQLLYFQLSDYGTRIRLLEIKEKKIANKQINSDDYLSVQTRPLR